jgi:hypothetical protein
LYPDYKEVEELQDVKENREAIDMGYDFIAVYTPLIKNTIQTGTLQMCTEKYKPNI